MVETNPSKAWRMIKTKNCPSEILIFTEIIPKDKETILTNLCKNRNSKDLQKNSSFLKVKFWSRVTLIRVVNEATMKRKRFGTVAERAKKAVE